MMMKTIVLISIVSQLLNEVQAITHSYYTNHSQIITTNQYNSQSNYTLDNHLTNLTNLANNNYHRFLISTSTPNSVNPLSKGMYPITLPQGEAKSSFEEPETIFDVPRQSTVKIIIDLRHLRNYTSDKLIFDYGIDWDIVIYTVDKDLDWSNKQNIDTLKMPDIFTLNQTQKINSHLFSVFAYKDMLMTVYIRILNSVYSNQRAVFAQTTSIKISTPMRTVLGENLSFAFVLQNNGVVNLPIALPIMKADNSYPDAIITYTQLDTIDSNEKLISYNLTDSTQKYLVNNDIYWKNLKQLTIPYIPYISNCKNYGEFIFLNDVIENAQLCKLYTAKQTIPVEQLGFLQAPTSDTCLDVQFNCLMDDAFFTQNQIPKLYESLETTELFYITSEPIDFQGDIFQDKIVFDRLDLIPVIAKNSVASSQLPKEITLTIEYFQVDKYRKRIIKSEMTFGQLIDKTKINSTLPFSYKFHFNLHSMNHAELAISFALNIPVYIILSIIIGVFSILLVLFYYCFFRISNRRVVGNPKPFIASIRCLGRVCNDLKQFYKLYIPIGSGIILGFIPNFFLLFCASFLMIGGFWGYPFFNCTDLSTENICETSIFESFGASQVTQEKRRGRLGFTLIVIGFYSCIRISSVFIPSSQQERVTETIKNYKNNKTNQKQNKFFQTILKLEDKVDFLTTESYDGNTWNDKVWLRGLYIFMTLLIIIIELVVIFLSFSTFYGLNIWFFTFILKISQIFIEETLKIYVENEVLLGSLSCVISMSNSVSGLGAIDFFDFLFNTFINLGISTFEKTNQVIAVELVAEKVIIISKVIYTWIGKVFHIESNQNEEYNEEDQELLEENREKNDKLKDSINKDEDNSQQMTGQKDAGNSSIFLTDNCEESLMSIDFQEQDWNFQQENTQRQKLQYKNSIKAFDDLKEFKKSETIKYKKANFVKDQQSDDEQITIDPFEIAFSQLLNQKFNRKTSSLTARQQTKGKYTDSDQNEVQKSNLQVKIFADFCNNTFNLFFTPCQVLVLWMFYDTNQMFVKWGITKKGLVYYYLFNILNIPFQIMVDILFLKTVEQLHRINVREYFFIVNEKFKLRYLTWKVDEQDNDEKFDILEPDLKYIHRWCFSPQFFFCLSLFVAGCIGIIEGVITCIVNNYNFFSDSSSFFYIICFWLPVCFAVDFVCVQFLCNRIWGIKPKKEENIPNIEVSDLPSPIPSNDTKDITKLATLKSPPILFQKGRTQKQFDDPMINIISQDNLIQKNSNINNNNNNDQIQPDQEQNQINSMNWLQTSRMINSVIPDFLKNHTAPIKSKFKIEEPHNIILQKTLPYQEFYSKLHSFSQDESFCEEMNDLKQDIERDRYLKLFLEDQIEQLHNCDFSVHQFILSYTSQQEEQKNKLIELFIYNFKRFKIQQDAIDQYQKLKNFDFLKAIQEKEKKSRYEDIKQHFKDNEYKDQKFLRQFLLINKSWLRKNMKLFFDDLMFGENKKQLHKLRGLILEKFSKIYGELKAHGSSQEIQLKNLIKKPQPLKSDINNQYQGTQFHQILKYWKQRSRVLSVAQQLVGGYFMRGDGKFCYYCKSHWGLTVQTSHSNVEDLFRKYYKSECHKFKIIFNIFELFENDRLVFENYSSPTKYRSYNNFFYQQEDSNNFHGDNYSSPPRSMRGEELELDEDNDYSEDQQENESVDTLRRVIEKGKAGDIAHIFKQRFVDKWQEYFFSNANIISVCFKCNDSAQDQYMLSVLEERKKKERQLQLIKDTIQTITSLKSNYLIRQSTLQEIDELDNSKKDSQLPSFNFNPIIFKKVGDNMGTSQIIEEECNEDQSQNEDKLSKFDDSFRLNQNNEVIQQKYPHNHPTIENTAQQKRNSSQSKRNSPQQKRNSAQPKRNSALSKRKASKYSNNEDDDDDDDDDDDYNNLNQKDGHLQIQRKQSTKLNKSLRSIKSQESRTHPLQTDMDDEVRQPATINELNQIKSQMEEENNKSFRILSARKNSQNQLVYYDDFQERDQIRQNQKSRRSSDGSSFEEGVGRDQEFEDFPRNQNGIQQEGDESEGSSEESEQPNKQDENKLPIRKIQNITQKGYLDTAYRIQTEPTDREAKINYNPYIQNKEDLIEEGDEWTSEQGQQSSFSRRISNRSKHKAEENEKINKRQDINQNKIFFQDK